MSLNLVTDVWIPVIRDGRRDVIRPDQIAEPGVERPDWPRADLNLACHEFLIGLIYLACPPRDVTDWRARRQPDPEMLRAAFAPYAPAFELGGDGPRFLQDLEPLAGDANPPDMLFIDAAGESTARKNADLMVHRGRFATLDLPTAAMALFTLQSQAPSGGAGNRTSMRGGGPLITLVRPEPGPSPLWSTIWANVPEGPGPQPTEGLPWMRPTVTSEKGQMVVPVAGPLPAEAFFGMPRRLRLVVVEDRVTGVIQRPWGTNYGPWRHPLSPYYAMKVGAEILPRHPRPGAFHYRNWLGIVVESTSSETAFRATAIDDYGRRDRGAMRADVIAAGWAMSNMSPLDFLWSEQPLFPLDPEAAERAAGMVQAAELAAGALVGALKAALGISGTEASRIEVLRERFFLATQPAFEAQLAALARGGTLRPEDWRHTIARTALGLFDAEALPGLAEHEVVAPDSAEFAGKPSVKTIVEARQRLGRSLHGKKMAEALVLMEEV